MAASGRYITTTLPGRLNRCINLAFGQILAGRTSEFFRRRGGRERSTVLISVFGDGSVTVGNPADSVTGEQGLCLFGCFWYSSIPFGFASALGMGRTGSDGTARVRSVRLIGEHCVPAARARPPPLLPPIRSWRCDLDALAAANG